MDPDKIRQIIEEGMDTELVQVSGEGGKYEAVIVSKVFEGISMLKQHKMVYPLLNDHIKTGEIHALTIKSYTPRQWAEKADQG